MPLNRLIERRALRVVTTRLTDEPVIAIHGARAVGKSTLLAHFAASRGVEVFDLDDLSTRDVAAADPAGFVSGPAPVCIDEYQHVPEILDAIKAELNRDLRPGRFVLTGSTRYESLPVAAQSLTGRLHVVPVWPLSQGEIASTHENFLERLISDPDDPPGHPPSATTKADYIARILTGGFPLALARRSVAARDRWFDDYVRQVLERDVVELTRIRQRQQLPVLLRRLASQTGQVLNIASAAKDSRIDETTAADYVKLLEAVFLVHRLEAWGTTLRSRVSGRPKIHLVDPGIAGRLLRLSSDGLARRDATSLTELGHLSETFVVGELLRQASWLDGISGSGHWRTHDGDEVDLVIERDDGGVLAFEVKARGRVSADDMRGLRKLRGALGDRFVSGFVLYMGDRSYTVSDALHVIPIDRLWLGP